MKRLITFLVIAAGITGIGFAATSSSDTLLPEAAKKDANSAATRSAAEKLGDVTRDRALLIAKIGAEVRPLLTPEQQKHIEAARGELESLVDAALNQIGG